MFQHRVRTHNGASVDAQNSSHIAGAAAAPLHKLTQPGLLTLFKANPSQENASSVQDGRKVLSASSVSKGKRQGREETAKGRTDETGKGTAASGAAAHACLLRV